MAESVEAKISDLLLGHLAEFPQSPALPIAWPGLPFTPPSGTYLEATLIPNTNVNRGLGTDDSTQFRGILQVAVMASANEGIIAAMEIASHIADHFERGTALSEGTLRVKFEGRPSIAPYMQEPDRLRIPVSIRWHAFWRT